MIFMLYFKVFESCESICYTKKIKKYMYIFNLSILLPLESNCRVFWKLCKKVAGIHLHPVAHRITGIHSTLH